MPRGKQEVDFDKEHDVSVTDGTTTVTASWHPYTPGSWYYGESSSGSEYRLPKGYKIVKTDV
jgi:hypothetical protein